MDKRIKTFLVILILMLALRLIYLENQEFATDESLTIEFAEKSLSLDSIKSYQDREPHSPLYNIITALLMKINSSIWFLRLITVLISVIGFSISYLFFRKLFVRSTALFASFLLGIMPMNLIFSRHLRSYALLMFCFILSTYLLWLVLFEKKSHRVWWLIPIYIFAFYLHFFAAFFIAMHFFTVLLFYFRKKIDITILKKYFLVCFLVGIVWLLWVPIAITQVNEVLLTDGRIGLYTLTLPEIPYPFYKFAVMADFSTITEVFKPIFLLFPLLTILVLLGAWKFWQQDKEVGYFLAFNFFGVIAIPLILTPLSQAFTAQNLSFYYFRYFVYLTPMYIIFLTKGLESKHKVLQFFIILLLIAGWLWVDVYYFTILDTIDWSALIAV